MAMNTDLSSSETNEEEVMLEIKGDDNIQDNETKTIGSVELTELTLESPSEGGTSTAEAHEKSGDLKLKASEENSTRSIGSTEVQMMLLSLLLAVTMFIAGGAYAALLNFHEVFSNTEHVKTVNLSIFEILTFPSGTTEGFLFLSATTAAFMTSMSVISYALCLICGRWTSLATLSLFVIAAMCLAMFLSFFAMLSKLVPHFVTVGGGHAKVPGAWIVVFYSIYMMVLIPTILAFIVQRVIHGKYM
ncbi:uncharacterized protein LOC132615499 [Lycium barbarum]|uniref:uncharacterized protein LOC132615499 n=1 Tax=Lycium barbarum TaxID=112863 RepID=UPI00293F6E56|nr:uncharacterized protein LOC132615499 [Lycium barbarum]